MMLLSFRAIDPLPPGEEAEIMVETMAVNNRFKPAILVIDDEERVREGCRKVLAREGYEVSIAECGEDGLKMIEGQHYDIILLDLMMPSLSGFDVLAHVKGLHPDTVIIVISGYATVENSIEAMKRGAFDFIPKPFSPEQLRVLIKKAIEYTRAMQDIADEKSRMRVLINRLTEGVMVTDSQKRVVLANPAFLRMAGCRKANAVGCAVSEINHYEQLDQMIDKALAIPEHELAELTEEICCEAEAGQPGPILNARCLPFRDRAGRNVGTITVLHDITTLKHMDQIKSDFVSMVSHEIRSPLNSVLAQIKVILDGLAGEVTQQQQEILSRASEKVKSLVSLSSELLDLARIESGLITQEKEQLNLSDILADQVAFHSAKAQAKGISLDLEPLPELAPVFVDRRNMEEVFSNLISNAINYTPEGGKVTVAATMESGYLKASVRDTGIGMVPEELGHIFNTFYRIKNDKTRFIIGTGLGLAIVKRIIEGHNGFIRVESKPDCGSTFHVYIPCPGS
jgi:two-component system phosphate regulon sensor histidine kinase PhoR